MRTKKIKWDTDGDKEVFEALPQEVELPGDSIVIIIWMRAEK